MMNVDSPRETAYADYVCNIFVITVLVDNSVLIDLVAVPPRGMQSNDVLDLYF